MLCLILCFLHYTESQPDCTFARSYSLEALFYSPDLQHQFLLDAAYWEGKFARDKIGINIISGLTYDGTNVDYDTGLAMPDRLHKFSAASKEAVHLSLLALALADNPYAIRFFNSSIEGLQNQGSVRDYVLDQLTRKLNAYRDFNSRYPGFGGFLPWYGLVDNGSMQLLWDWPDRVPSLDNGEMIWGLVAVVEQLRNLNHSMAQPYQDYVDMLAVNGLMIFYHTTGAVSGHVTVAKIANVTAKPERNNYAPEAGCSATSPCFLDDPYEGELFAFFLHLYADWTSYGGNASRNQIWVSKRPRLQSVNFTSPLGPVTVEKGWTYSAHEKWKYMELPYFDSAVNERVFLNGERARTHFSRLKQYNGLFAACANYSLPNRNDTYDPAYVASVGIQEISYQTVETEDLISPYGAYPLLLHPLTRRYGIVWYATMLKADRMQGPQGSTEACKMSGEFISPVNTWDTKITNVLAFSGGVIDQTRAYLQRTGKYDEFISILDREWTMQFGSRPLLGSTFEFALPAGAIPTYGNAFSTCATVSGSSATVSDSSTATTTATPTTSRNASRKLSGFFLHCLLSVSLIHFFMYI